MSEPTENKPEEQRDKYKRSKCAFGSWANAVQASNYEDIRTDYLSGNYTIAELVGKYDVRERSLLWYVRTKWKKLLIADGKTPPVEPKMRLKSNPPGMWKDLELEWRHGAGVKELAAKYHVHPITIAKKMSKEGWVLNKKALPGWGARSYASPQEFGIRMENFTTTVRNHVERVLVVLDKFKYKAHNRIPIEQVERIGAALNIISRSFASIVDTGLKLYKFTAVSYEAEEAAIEEAHTARGFKAISAGMQRGGPVAPNKKAVPIRIEQPSGAALHLGNATHQNSSIVELRSNADPGTANGQEDRAVS